MILLRLGLRIKELPRLREVVGKRFGTDSSLRALHGLGKAAQPVLGSCRGVSGCNELGE